MFRPKTPIVPASTTANALATTGASVNVSAAAPPLVGQVLRATSSTTATWQTSSSLPAGWVSVVDYGALGDYSTNDDAAFAAAYATGKHVFIPSGTMASPKHYILSTTITPAEGQMTFMDGTCLSLQKSLVASGTPYAFHIADILSQNGSLMFIGTTNYLFDMKAHRIVLDGVNVCQHPSYIPTAGGHFKIGSDADAYSPFVMKDHITLRNCCSYGGYNGAYVNGRIYRQRMTSCSFYQSVFACININLITPAGDLQWTDINILAAHLSAADNCTNTIGLYVQACDTSMIDGISIKYCKTPMWLYGNTSTINQLRFVNLDIETSDATQGNIKIGDGTYDVTRCTFTNVEVLGPSGLNSFVLGLKAKYNSCSQMQLIYCNYTDAGTGNILTSSQLQNLGVTKARTGIYITGTGAIIGNNFVKDMLTGYGLAVAANYVSVTGNNFTNNTAAASMDAAAKATGRGSTNIGVADW